MADTLQAIVESVLARGDLAHLALFLWAGSASALAWFALKELSRSNRRFEDFVAAIAHAERLLRQRR